ncbi:AraC family transcriptional regulator [Thalassotalea psychrophila]|uniref:AraC family transcriptional regulator n=1 Tax=Thalassotalea psychrophila TaxID=3065647 RepID=A0ABY9TYD3_9GAMM|nr:AraC family transcriptional regulator [Colwelliaceae bacterium SQ149]
MKKNTIIYHYVQALVNSLNRHGKDSKAILANCDIPAFSGNNNELRIPTDNFVKLLKQTIVELDDEHFGLVEPALPIGSFFYASHVMSSCANLGKALELGIGYYQLNSNAYKIELVEHIDEIEFRVSINKPELDPDHLLAEFVLNAWHRFASWMIGKNILLKSASFNYAPPKHESEYQYLFPCLRKFDQQWLSFTFSRDYLAMPIIKKNTGELEQYLRNTFQNLLFTPIDDQSLTAKIRLIIEGYEENNFPTFTLVADKLFMTEKTLRARLNKEGGSYQKIKDYMRRDSAIYYLTKQNLSIAEIAFKSGFSEPSGFIRAFKKWTGSTPTAYRVKE